MLNHTRNLQAQASAAQSFLAIASAAVFTTFCAQIRIPLGFTPVPVTLQTFAVVLAGLVIGRRLGLASQALYITAGCAGLPVFSGWTGGAAPDGSLLPTLGYILAFPAGAWVAGSLWQPERDSRPATALAAAAAGMAVIHAGGFAWLTALASATNGPAHAAIYALKAGVLPFALLDLAKAASAVALACGGHAAAQRTLGHLRG